MNAQSTLLARQPIFDRKTRAVGYEVLFRYSGGTSLGVASPEHATAEVGVQALLDIGLDRLVGAKRAWINIPRGTLVGGLWEFFPPDRVVLELLETVEADAEVVEAVKRARSLGYSIALDDFVLGERTSELVPLADYVKLDVVAHDPEGLVRTLEQLRRPDLALLAEKVETHAVCARMRELGCDLFQGYYFARPKLVKGRRLPNNRLALLRVVASLQDEHAPLEKIEELVRADVGLSYRLLRYVNSAAIGMLAPIESLRHAIMTLGLEKVRACVTVLLLTALDQRPDELITVSLVRARYCQFLCKFHGLDPHRGFLVGLFSSIDAFLDRDLSAIVKELGLADELVRALVAHEGDYGLVLEAAIACETAEFERVEGTRFLDGPLHEAYLDALTWTAEIQSGLASS
jgi:EAL and modified HD-GYP domain-containing signal transduction protein